MQKTCKARLPSKSTHTLQILSASLVKRGSMETDRQIYSLNGSGRGTKMYTTVNNQSHMNKLIINFTREAYKVQALILICPTKLSNCKEMSKK